MALERLQEAEKAKSIIEGLTSFEDQKGKTTNSTNKTERLNKLGEKEILKSISLPVSLIRDLQSIGKDMKITNFSQIVRMTLNEGIKAFKKTE